MKTKMPIQAVTCRFFDGDKGDCRALNALVCAERRCSMRQTVEEHVASCERARKRCRRVGVVFREVSVKEGMCDDGRVRVRRV